MIRRPVAGMRRRGALRGTVLISLVAACSAAFAPAAAARSGDPLWPWDDAGLARAAERYFDHLYRMDYATCSAIVDTLESRRPMDPLVCILRARILRDVVREVDVTRTTREEQFAQLTLIFAELNARAHRRLEEDPADPRAHLALGWAGMMTAQVEVMMKEYWSANKTSKKAREHVEKVLQRLPQQPDAKFLLGAYLYMVDTLPRFLKLLKWIPFLGIPSGDREEGLRMIREASRSPVPTARDYDLFLAFINLFYEGEFDECGLQFWTFYEGQPHNPRFALPLALVAPFDPAQGRLADRYWRILIERWEEDRAPTEHAQPWWFGKDRWSASLALRIRLMAAFQWEALGRPDLARPMYESLRRDPLTRAYRLKGASRTGLARTALLTGNGDLALDAVQEILEDDSLEAWHDQAKALREEIVRHPPDAGRTAFWREASQPLMDALESVSRPASARESSPAAPGPFPRSRLPEMEAHRDRAGDRDPVATKLLGTAYLLAGLPTRALAAYEQALDRAQAPSLWPVRVQIHLDRAFAFEQLHRYRDALKEFERALDLVPKPDLLRYTLESRLESAARAAKR